MLLIPPEPGGKFLQDFCWRGGFGKGLGAVSDAHGGRRVHRVTGCATRFVKNNSDGRVQAGAPWQSEAADLLFPHAPRPSSATSASRSWICPKGCFPAHLRSRTRDFASGAGSFGACTSVGATTGIGRGSWSAKSWWTTATATATSCYDGHDAELRGHAAVPRDQGGLELQVDLSRRRRASRPVEPGRDRRGRQVKQTRVGRASSRAMTKHRKISGPGRKVLPRSRRFRVLANTCLGRNRSV